MPKPAREYLDFMGAWWSCSPEALQKIKEEYEAEDIIELRGKDVFQLKRKPRGPITRFRNESRSI